MAEWRRCAGYGCARSIAFAILVGIAADARAETVRGDFFAGFPVSRDTLLLALFVALVLFASVVSFLHMTTRRRMQQRETALALALNEERARVDRVETFLAAESQVTIVWGLQGDEPEVEGDVTLVSDAPIARRVLGFGSWLPPGQAQQLEALVANLRERGEPFRLGVVGLNGRHLETEGRAVTGRAVMRIREVSGDRLEATRLRDNLAHAQDELAIYQSLLDSIPCPAWTRDDLGRLSWVNTAYIRAVEAKDRADAMTQKIELLESATREASVATREQNQTYRGKAVAVVQGRRRAIDVTEVPHARRAVGIVFDVSELDEVYDQMRQATRAHGRTLDQLSTAVAIFDRRKRLVFYNAAYRQLWNFDPAFLDNGPDENEVLDRLRARHQLPEQADFRAWKEAHMVAAYQALETSEHVWYIPDGRTLRAVVNPNPQSGVTYLFDDVTAARTLEIEFNNQTRVLREVLDTLKEGVAVFGTDGKLKLANRALGALWKLEPTVLDGKPHVDHIAELCMARAPDPKPWRTLRTTVTGLHDRRLAAELRLTCRDGTIIDCTTAPLPDGATLLTFTDTTASVNVERALTDRNEALLETERLRNDFVHHVSYELRSPLTNIIGFIQMLGEGTVGSLNPKQTEYVGYVMKSSAALLAIINDILDLATIDTGALELKPERIDVRETIEAAAEGVQDRLTENTLNLQIVVLPNVGSFSADPKRIRQILFNLLSNAIGFSSPGQTVTLSALRHGEEIAFKVQDQGRGIPHDVIPHVFERFHSSTLNTRHRGVGLGLSIVKSFVELHGGRVHIDSAPGVGTTVTCMFPAPDDKVIENGPGADLGRSV